ncbi:hypothetical protein NUACC26_101410 [Scytonema sp. NUACC26]
MSNRLPINQIILLFDADHTISLVTGHWSLVTGHYSGDYSHSIVPGGLEVIS